MKTKEDKLQSVRSHLNSAFLACDGDLAMFTDALVHGMEERGRTGDMLKKSLFTSVVYAIVKVIKASGNRKQLYEMIFERNKL